MIYHSLKSRYYAFQNKCSFRDITFFENSRGGCSKQSNISQKRLI